VCVCVSIGSRETTETNFFSTAVRLPVRERSTSTRKRPTTSPSFLLTSDSHMAYVADKLAKKKPKSSSKTVSKGRPKKQSTNKATQHKHDSTKCAHCSVMYGAANDKRKEDDWVQCLGCNKWWHESCAEVVGLLDETEFHCKDCL